MSSPNTHLNTHRIVVRTFEEVVGEPLQGLSQDIEEQKLPPSFQEQCKHYLGRAVRHIKNDVVPTLQPIIPPEVGKAVTERFWVAPCFAFGLATFSNYPSWLLNTTSGVYAEVMDHADFFNSHSTATNVTASMLALHMLKGSYTIIQCVRNPSIQNTLGAIFDVAATIKYLSIITKLTNSKTD